MARAKIQINAVSVQSSAVTIGSIVQLSNDDNGGEITYAWSVLDQPEGTADVLSSVSIENPTITITKEGSYQIRLIVNATLPSESVQTAVVYVVEARTGDRIPAASETIEVSTARGWASATNRLFKRALAAGVDGNLVIAQTPGSIAIGSIVKLTALATVNAGSQSTFDVPQIALVTAVASIAGRVGYLVDGVTTGNVGAGKLVLVRVFGLIPTAGSGSPAVGDPVFLSDAGIAALAAGTVSRVIGRVASVSGGSYRWVIDGVATGLADGSYGDVTVGGGGTTLTVNPAAISNAKLVNMAAGTLKGSVAGGVPADLTATQVKSLLTIAAGDVSGLAAIATSGSASNLGAGTVPAARMPALTGDVTSTVGTTATTIGAAAVSNAKLANMAANTLKGSIAGGAPADLTAAQVKTLLAIAAGDVSGLAAIATSGSAADLSTGTIPAARMPAHTGDVTSTVNTVALTIAANAVDNTKLAQMAGNTVKSNLTGAPANAVDNTIAALLAALAVRLGELGDASDGNATMDGSTAVTGYSLAGSTYTATGYANFDNLTINAGITVDQRSWPGPICRGTCTNNGHVSWDGASASGQTAGIASVATGPLPLGSAGGNGGAVNAGTGSNGTAGAANAAPRGFATAAAAGGVGTISPAAVNPGTAGGVGHGAGGGGTLGSGGSGGGQSALPAASGDWRQKHIATVGMCPTPGGNNVKLSAGTGGGGGAGGGGANGGVGGGGGAGASYGVSKAFAYAGSGTWTAVGGNGGNGANASGIASDGGGGGASGSGGIVVFVSAGTPPTASVLGGTPGNGGTGQTTGRTGGTGGAGGAGLTANLF